MTEPHIDLDRFEETIRRHVASRNQEQSALLAQVDEARARLDEHRAVMQPRSAEISAQIAALAAETKAAHRRISAARARLTRAQRSGGVGSIAAAEAYLNEVTAAYEQISDANIAEGFRLMREGQDNLSRFFELMRAADRPYTAWLDSLRGDAQPTPPTRRTP